MKQNKHALTTDNPINSVDTSNSSRGQADEGNSTDKIRGGGLPCRVFLTPVYEETLPENNHPPPPSSSSSSSSSTSTEEKEKDLNATLATSTKHERSHLLTVGLLPPGQLGSNKAHVEPGRVRVIRLYCVVLCCVVLYCTVLYCTVLYCTVLFLLGCIYNM